MKVLDLETQTRYSICILGNQPTANSEFKEVTFMKLTIRIVAFTVVLAGVAAASVPSSRTQAVSSSQSATARMPVPLCAPGLPTCPNTIPTVKY